MEAIKLLLLKIFTILDDSLKDNATGLYSHARIIAMLVALAATVFMWKLILTGGMTIDYFLAYLTYGTGAQTLNKFLDNRDPTRNTIVEASVAKPAAPVAKPAAPTLPPAPVIIPSIEDLPKPPKI